MSYTYEGSATVTVMTLCRGQPPVELTTFDCAVRLSNASPGRTRIELKHYLQGPKEANTLRVMLPSGLMVQGALIDGCNEPTGGWQLIDLERYDLTKGQPASLEGWQWE